MLTRRVVRALALIVGLTGGLVLAAPPRGWSGAAAESPYRKPYRFSGDTFTAHIPLWKQVLSPLAGKPNLHYLEIGVFEGRSALWVLEHVLTDPTSRMTCIDLFPGDMEQHFRANLELSGVPKKATVLKGFSQIVLKQLPLESFDLIYIDGSHVAKDVLVDAVLSWQLLKPGGILMFDDYLYKQQTLPPELRPQLAIDAFLAAYKTDLTVVNKGYQVIVTKQRAAVSRPRRASP